MFSNIRTRLYTLAGLFIVVGVAITIRGRAYSKPLTETQIENMTPSTLPGYTMLPAGSTGSPTSDLNVTYKMDDVTYSLLQPWGIVSRVFQSTDLSKPQQVYDTVVIPSDNTNSFHDPTICFTNQNNEIFDIVATSLPTKSFGNIEFTLLKLKNLKNGTLNYAGYTFKGPSGFHRDQDSLLWDLYLRELKTGQPQKGVFYRFIDEVPINGNDPASEQKKIQDMYTFAGDFIDQTEKTSKGMF